MTEHFNPHNRYERDQAGDQPESTRPKTSRMTYMNRGRGAVGAALGADNPFMPKPRAERPAIAELTPEQITANAARMDARESELRTGTDERMATTQAPETTDTINIVGGKIYGGGVEVGGLSPEDEARVNAAANIGLEIANRAAEATAGHSPEGDDDQGDSLTVTRDGTIVVRGDPQIGTIVGGQVHRYPR
jgi:hypothetical protein